MMAGHEMGAWGIGMMVLMPLFWILIFVAPVWLIVRATRRSPSADPRSRERTPLEVLEQRLAGGEIDIEEFHSRRSALVPRPSEYQR